jgi:hypothetical protein
MKGSKDYFSSIFNHTGREPAKILYPTGDHAEWLSALQLRGVKPLPLPEMAELFNNLHMGVAPGLVRAS